MEEEILNGRQLSPMPEKSLSGNRTKVEMDGIAAAWWLFQFSRQTKDKRVSHQIRTILPNGSLQILHIEVECEATKLSADGKTRISAGIPGAFAQDIFISLISHLVHHMREHHSDLFARAQAVGLKGVSLPSEATEVYFRNKDLAQTMGMVEKNRRITETLQHLHKTHIKIRGCIYKNGKEETIQHDTYYIPSLTSGNNIGRTSDKSEWHRAKFDDDLVKQILQGYIAQMDTEKLLRLPSGAPRKMYTLLAAKTLENKNHPHTQENSETHSRSVVVTRDEIIATLRITEGAYKKLSKKYFQYLINAGIISGYSFSEHRGIDVVVFALPKDETTLLPPTAEQVSKDFFSMLVKVGKTDPKLARVLTDETLCDLDCENLKSILRKNMSNLAKRGDKYYPKAVLWADMLIYNKAKGQGIKSIVALLKSLLSKDEEPVVQAGFLPVDIRYQNLEAKKVAAVVVESTQKKTDEENAKVRETADEAWSNYSEAQKDRLTDAIKQVMTGGTDSWSPQPAFVMVRATDVLRAAVSYGIAVSDVFKVIKWYQEEGKDLSESHS